MCTNAVMVSFEMGLPLIIVFTVSGLGALILSKLKPKAHIIAISDESETIRGLTIARGVTCLRVPTI